MSDLNINCNSNPDRRDFPRIKLTGITLIKTNSDSPLVINGSISDVSASGLKITLDSSLEVGTEIKLSILVGVDELIFLISGVVLWVSSLAESNQKPAYQCGVEILYEENNRDYEDWRALFIA